MDELSKIENRDKVIQKFLEAGKRIAPYYHGDHQKVPEELQRQYDRALYKYRNYLDQLGLKMPKPRYKIDINDVSSWIYKICNFTSNKKYFRPIWKLNKDCPYYDQFIADNNLT